MILYYVRHGDPVYNPDSLTELGVRQAESVCKYLARRDISKIYTSSAKRAIDTAKPLCEMMKITPEILDWTTEDYAWREFTAVSDDGKKRWATQTGKFAEMMASKPVRDLGEEWYTYKDFPESFALGIKRIRENTYAFLKEFGYEYDAEKNMYNAVSPNNKNIALFAHGGFGSPFLATVIGIPYPLIENHFDLTHTGVTVIGFSEKEGYCFPKVIQYSGDGHLYHDNLPAKYPGFDKYIR